MTTQAITKLQAKYDYLNAEWKKPISETNNLFTAVYFLKKILDRGIYHSVSDLREQNARAGKYFFSKDTMKMFGCKIESAIIHDSFLIISNKTYDNKSREFKIVIGRNNGDVDYLLDTKFDTKTEAKKMLKLIIKNTGI